MKNTILKLLKIYGAYKKIFFFIIVLLFISTAANLLTPIINKVVIDQGFLKKNIKLILVGLSVIFMLRIIDLILTYIIERNRVKISKEIKMDLEMNSFEKMMNMKICNYQNDNVTGMISRLDVDINAIGMLVEGNFFSALTQFISIFGGIVGLIYIEWRLLVLMFVFIFLKYVVIRTISNKNEILTRKYIESMNGFAQWYSNILYGIKEVKVYDLKKIVFPQFRNKAAEKNEIKRKMDFNESLKTILETLLSYLLDFLMYILGGYLVYKSNLSVGSVFAFLTYSTYISNPISTILGLRYILSQIAPSVDRYTAFMREEGETEEGVEIAKEVENLELENVSFNYNLETSVLENVNLQWRVQKINGLVGANGSGKSTIIDLLLRFYEPANGYIKLNGKDIKKYNLQQYRNLFSVVSQQIYLFNDSIRNNLTLGKEVPDSKIKKFMAECGLEEFLIDKGLDYQVGENGINLSGGERQKLGLVRAMIQNRPIILLDEATSNADVFLEKNIGRIIKQYFNNKTIILITHRMNNYKICSSIFYLNNYKVLQYDNYEVFLQENQEYNKEV